MRRPLAVVLVCLLALSAVAGPPVAAQSDSGLVDSLTDDEGASGFLKGLLPGATSIIDRVQYTTTGEPDPETHADALESTYNDNSATIEDWVNPRFSRTESEWNVIKIELTQGDETATRYLVADVNNGSFENSSITDETDRSVDRTVTIEDYAVTKADDELAYFIAEHAEPDSDLDTALRSRMAQYKTNIELPEGV